MLYHCESFKGGIFKVQITELFSEHSTKIAHSALDSHTLEQNHLFLNILPATNAVLQPSLGILRYLLLVYFQPLQYKYAAVKAEIYPNTT